MKGCLYIERNIVLNQLSTEQNQLIHFYLNWYNIIPFWYFFPLCFLFLAHMSGSDPVTVYIFSDKATVEFVTSLYENFNGFNATYTAFNTSELTGKYTCNLYFSTTAK